MESFLSQVPGKSSVHNAEDHSMYSHVEQPCLLKNGSEGIQTVADRLYCLFQGNRLAQPFFFIGCPAAFSAYKTGIFYDLYESIDFILKPVLVPFAQVLFFFRHGPPLAKLFFLPY
jgi:hypothetical protein